MAQESKAGADDFSWTRKASLDFNRENGSNHNNSMSLYKKLNNAKRNRTSPRQDSLVQHLREGISRGRWKPGEQLPTVQQIVSDFDVSSVTVQRAIDQLNRDGFIRTAHRQGLFVADRLPNRNRFAIVFPHRPVAGEFWSLYWKSLAQAGLELEESTGIEFPVFYDIAQPHQTRDFEDLARTVASDRVAGLIFAHSPHNLIGTPVLDHPGIPRVAFMSQGTMKGVVHVTGCSGVVTRAVDWLWKRGRRRIAMLTLASPSQSEHVVAIREFNAALAARGASAPPYHLQAAHPASSVWSANAVHGMLHPNQSDRPDGLIIADDNLAMDAQRGVIASGINPADLDIVSHCNFPCTPPAVPAFPMQLIGMDAREVLAACASVILQMRNGVTTPIVPRIPSRLETEKASVESLAAGLREAAAPFALV
jgi:DNA-binding LacI/PurR family transcriptional regulator/DNA-binding transcriptional regulator YhcF (GntR family)